MQKLIFILCMCITFKGVSQVKQNPSIKISSAKFAKAKKVTNLIPAVKGCNVTGYHFSTNIGNNVKSFTVKNADITAAMKTIVKEVKKGEKVIIDNITSNCPNEYKRKYIFIIN